MRVHVVSLGDKGAMSYTEHRSQTVIVVNVKDKSASNIIKQVQNDVNMVIGSGYGDFKDTQLRIANFPAVSLGQVETLIDALKKV